MSTNEWWRTKSGWRHNKTQAQDEWGGCLKVDVKMKLMKGRKRMSKFREASSWFCEVVDTKEDTSPKGFNACAMKELEKVER